MKTPTFVPDEFVTAGIFNTATSGLIGNDAEIAAMALPGLIQANIASFGVTGMVLGSTLPAPFGVLFGTGQLTRAHGTLTNADTQSYTTDFTPTIPASGSVTAYLLASYSTIQQGPYQVLGPPVGHPDYNPNFTPYTAYNAVVNTLVLSASTTPPDNYNTFELCRFTISSTTTGLATPNLAFQVRESGFTAIQALYNQGTVTLTSGSAGKLYAPTAPGTTYMLPSASGSNGLFFGFASSYSGCTVQVNGADSIYGYSSTPSNPVSIAPIIQGTSFSLLGVNGAWQLVQSSFYTQAGSKTPSNPALPVIASVSGSAGSFTVGHFASFADINGTVEDLGYSPGSFDAAGAASTVLAYIEANYFKIANNLDEGVASAMRTSLGLGTAAVKNASNNSDSVVASVNGSITSGHIAVFSDTAGSVADGGPLPSAGVKTYATTSNVNIPNNTTPVTGVSATVTVPTNYSPVIIGAGGTVTLNTNDGNVSVNVTVYRDGFEFISDAAGILFSTNDPDLGSPAITATWYFSVVDPGATAGSHTYSVIFVGSDLVSNPPPVYGSVIITATNSYLNVIAF